MAETAEDRMTRAAKGCIGFALVLIVVALLLAGWACLHYFGRPRVAVGSFELQAAAVERLEHLNFSRD